MDVRRFEQKVWMVRLPGEPQLRPELALLRRRISDTDAMNLVLDLSRVEIVGSRSLGMLLRLHRLLSERGCRLILCHARPATKGVFRLTGLDGVFHLAANKSDALDILRQFPPSADEFPPEEEAGPPR